MAAQTLGKRLLKELKRGGKKTIVLGLLVLGGFCLWLPQLLKAVTSTNADSTTIPIPQQSTPTVSSNTQGAPQSAPATPGSDWKTLRTRLEDASLAQPATFDELVPDPFDRHWIRQQMASKKAQSDHGPSPISDPINTLICSATLVGPNLRAAIIGDKVYQVGQLVPFKGPIQYSLKEVHPDGVLLEREGKVVTLKVPQRSVDIDEEGQ